MLMDIQDVRGLFPDREFPTDEEIATKVAEKEASEAEAAAIVSRRQGLEAQIAELQSALASLDAPKLEDPA